MTLVRAKNSLDAVYDEILVETPLDALTKPSYCLLQRANIFSSLSARVYDALETDIAEPRSFKLTRLPQLSSDQPLNDSAPEATLLCGPVPNLPVHAVWRVQDLGVVAAFRGTDNWQDIFVDMNFAPVQLSSSDLRVHGAIYRAASKAIPSLRSAYDLATKQSKTALPLFLTGWSLSPM